MLSESVAGQGEPPLLPGCATRDALELLRLCWEMRPGQQQGRKGCSAVKEMLEKQEGVRDESTALQPCGRGGGERVRPGRGRGTAEHRVMGATPRDIHSARARGEEAVCFLFLLSNFIFPDIFLLLPTRNKIKIKIKKKQTPSKPR